MIRNITTQHLLMLEDQIQAMRSGILFLLFESKFQEFYRKNRIRINTAMEKRSDLWKEFLEIGENGQIVFEGEPPNQKPKLKEQIRQKEFEEKIAELMNSVVPIDV